MKAQGAASAALRIANPPALRGRDSCVSASWGTESKSIRSLAQAADKTRESNLLQAGRVMAGGRVRMRKLGVAQRQKRRRMIAC